MNVTGGSETIDLFDPAVKVGAVFLGAVLAWWSAYFFESRRLKEAKKGAAYGLIFKILKASDDIWKLNNHLVGAKHAADQAGGQTPLWSMLPDVLGFQANPEQITAQEIALVADTQDANLVMDILEIESGRSILMQSITKIQDLRAQMADLKLAIAVDGRMITFGGPAEDYPNYAHIFISLNDISDGLAEQAQRITEKASKVADRLGPHLEKHYKFKNFVTLAKVSPS